MYLSFVPHWFSRSVAPFVPFSADRVKLKAFSKFEDTNKALAAAAAICDGKLDKGLKKFLKATCVDKKLKVSMMLCVVCACVHGKVGK